MLPVQMCLCTLQKAKLYSGRWAPHVAGPALWTRLRPQHMCLLFPYLCQLTPRYLTVVVGCCPAMSAVEIGQRVRGRPAAWCNGPGAAGCLQE